MLAAIRAELLVLRKWPAAWGLLLVVPALALVGNYVWTLVTYLTATPAQYAVLGTPAQNLPSVLPSQFIIVAVQLFPNAVAPFVVLGAVMAGGDWARGTIGTSLLAGPGRVRSAAGQAAALAVAVTASVVTTFVVCGAASLLIRALLAKSVNPVDGAIPPTWIFARALAAALLTALTYGALGLFLGTVCRSAAGGIGAALAWTVIIEPTFTGLGLDVGGTLQKIGDFLPISNAYTVTGLFGTVGGGAGSQNYLPTSPAIAPRALAGYAALFLIGTFVLVRRRDVLTGRASRRPRRVPAAPAIPAPAIPATVAGMTPGWASRVLASLRAELLVMRNRPALWTLLLAVPADMLIGGYLTDYVEFRTAGTGGIGSTSYSAPLILPGVLPGQYLTTALNSLGTFSNLYGPAALFLLGTLVAGSDWGRGTIRTALLQGPGRLQTWIGRDLAVLLAAAAAVLVTFALAAVITTGMAAGLSRQAPPLDSQFPAATRVLLAVAGALLLALACTAIGLALGTILRSATKAAAVVLLWTVVIQPTLDQTGPQLHGVLLRLYETLPDASMDTVVNFYNPNTVNMGGSIQAPTGVILAPALAFVILAGYLLVSLAIPAVITRRRSL